MKKVSILCMVIALCSLMRVFAENRIALLIANANYRYFSSLSGPVLEAKELSSALKSLGFDAKVISNATKEEMLDEIDNIKKRVNGNGGIAFFHYGGHAVQSGGRNYLLPADVEIPDERRLATRAIDIDEVMNALDGCGSETNIVILDACRNNPLPAGIGRSASRGLTVVGVKPKNSIIVYSAEAGTVALDGVFTPIFSKTIVKKGLSLTDALMQTRREVYQKTNGSQIPGEYNQLFSNIVFNDKVERSTVQENIKEPEPKEVVKRKSIPTKGLVAEYLFSNDVRDSTGLNRSGKNSDAITSSDRFGSQNSSFAFNGRNSYIELGNSNYLDLQGQYSISLWVNPDKDSNYGAILSKNENRNDQYFIYYDPSGAILFEQNNRDSWKKSNDFIQKGKWNHIVIVVDNNKISICINGDIKNVSKFPTMQTQRNNQNVLIGSSNRNTSQTKYFKGRIDDIRFYNRVLSDEEIVTLFNE